MGKSKITGLVLALFFLVSMFFIPTSDTLTVAGRNTLGLLFAVIALLVTDVLPIGITCILSTAFLVILGCVPNVSAALSGYTNKIVFFILVSFGISKAITVVPLSRRLLVFLIKIFGRSSSSMLLAFMICSSIVSSVMSNVAATAIFINVVLEFLKVYDNEADRRKTGKTFMIGLPVAAMIGGMMTPAGSSINLLAIGLLEEETGIVISFVEWMLYGIPLTLIMLPISWLIILRVHKPAPITAESINKYRMSIEVREPMSGKEAYVLAVCAAMFLCWILSSWFPVFDITVVAIIGLGLFFLPKAEILTWDVFMESVSWPAYFLVSSILSFGSTLGANGVTHWIASIMPGALALPPVAILFLLAVLVFLLLIPIPVAPALLTVLVGPFIGIAANTGISPALIVVLLACCSAQCYLLPLDTVPILTYMTGYYKMSEMFKSNWSIQVVMALVVAVWLPVAYSILF